MGDAVVGRKPELALLEGLLADGPPQALALHGPPGAGKTTLWQAGVAAAGGRAYRVLAARPSRAETRLPYAALTDLFARVDRAALTGLPRPQLRALEVALLRAEAVAAAPDPRAVALGVLSALRALSAREPLLVAVDDVQWVDDASTEALAFAARRLDGEPILFLLTTKDGARSPLERVLEPRGLERLEVGPLGAGATRRILHERLGLVLPRRVLRRIVEVAEGNPLLALELGRTLAGREPPEIGEELAVPEVLEGLLAARLHGLPDPVRRALLAVALSGDLPASDAAALAGAAAIDEALDARLLVADGDRLRVAYPLLAAAATRLLRTAERRELHRALAAAAGDEQLRAHHLALATLGTDAGVAASVAAAAAAAAARGAAEHAVALGRHALRLTPPGAEERVDRLLALAEHLVVAGEPQRAAELLAAEVERLPAGAPRARAHLLLADESRFAASHVDECGDHLERALAESEGDPGLRAIVAARMARHGAVARVERLADAEAQALEALPAARASGPDAEREVLHGLAWAQALRGRPVDDLLARFAAISPDAAQVFRSLDRVTAERLACRGEVAGARAILRRLLDLADARGEEWCFVRLRLGLCEVELRAGEWDAAEAVLDDWARSPDRDLLTAPSYRRCRALLAAGRGRAAEAERWAAEAIAGSEASGLRWDRLEALRVQGIAALLAHDPRRAAASLAEVWEHTRREGVDEPGAFPVAPDLVEALAALGRHEQARAVTHRLRALAEEQEHPWGLATAIRCGALVALASRSYDEQAGAALERASEDYERLGLRFDRARCLLILGRAQRRLKKWGAARRSLERAAAAFDEIGSDGWGEHARSELARVAARRPTPSGELTPAEQRVVELAASGLPNKEIASILFVGVHTIEVHLTHAYAKLGVRSRAQLAARLAARR